MSIDIKVKPIISIDNFTENCIDDEIKKNLQSLENDKINCITNMDINDLIEMVINFNSLSRNKKSAS